MNQNPEQIARDMIDAMLQASGWIVQSKNQINLTAGLIHLPICSLKEQRQIVQEIEGRLSVADKMEENINESLQQAEALRQSILKKAFEGKLK